MAPFEVGKTSGTTRLHKSLFGYKTNVIKDYSSGSGIEKEEDGRGGRNYYFVAQT